MSPAVRTVAFAAVIAVIAIGLPFVVPGYQALNLADALAYAIAILGLNILTG